MKLEQTFEVQAPIERVWAALTDVERIAPCLPGAAVTGRNDDGSYNGSFAVKIGPTSAAYTGRLEMRELDEAAHRATMHAQGTDRRGQGGAEATIISTVTETRPGVSTVAVDTDYRITGRLARFGRGGMIEDISEKLLRQFADQLQASLAAGEDVAGGGATAGGEPTATAGVGGAVDTATEATGTGDAGGPDTGSAGTPSAAAGPAPGAGAASEVDALSLIGSVLLKRVRRDPFPYVVAVLATVGWWRARRRAR
ncbi:SRPBCC family protein [Conexibacter sp. DBS9H8]|uniref:SRPBCC family protein n=1 Tax=Conexibacter sp. DBS9H8 TaxID=2937801 RepID=UPI00200EE165|nr:SRPBCC family protein [Conexibacter sp. DBS9H8]